MIRVNVFIQVSEANRSALVETANELVTKSVAEDGCIAYDLYESATCRDVLMICETWKDEETLAAHSNAPHFKSLIPKLQELGSLKIEQFKF